MNTLEQRLCVDTWASLEGMQVDLSKLQDLLIEDSAGWRMAEDIQATVRDTILLLPYPSMHLRKAGLMAMQHQLDEGRIIRI